MGVCSKVALNMVESLWNLQTSFSYIYRIDISLLSLNLDVIHVMMFLVFSNGIDCL